MVTPRSLNACPVVGACSVAMVMHGFGASVGGAYQAGLSMKIVTPS